MTYLWTLEVWRYTLHAACDADENEN